MALSTLLKRFPIKNLRSFSSGAPISFTLSFQPETESEPDTPHPNPNDDLRGRIFRLRLPKRSATTALERWLGEGKQVSQSELRQIARDLTRSKRYKHALEIMTWMKSQDSFQLRALDHAITLKLITKVHNLSEAEAYFDKLPSSSSQKAAAFPLLHSYVMSRDLSKAESLMQRLLDSGLAVDPHLFNEMMKLYRATNQFDRVLSVIRHMKLSKIPLNSVSYSLWLNAANEVSGLFAAEFVYNALKNNNNVELGWSTYVTIANIYLKARRINESSAALKIAETKLSLKNRLAYSFIMTSYAALKDKVGVLRVWELIKKVPTRITCVNYMSVMRCLIKIGDIKEAERIFREWESQCNNYDVRVSNVLLGAYVRNGWMDEAEALHMHTMEKGASPNYKTWEILMDGWVNSKQMDKAVEAMKKGFSKLKDCIWRPPLKITLAFAEHFEKLGNVEEMRSYIKVLHGLGIMSLPVYKSALRAHVKAEAGAFDIVAMIEKAKIELDEETRALMDIAKKPRDPRHHPLESFLARFLR